MSFSQARKESDVNFLLSLSNQIQELEELIVAGENIHEISKKTEHISLEITKISQKIKSEPSKFVKLRLQKDFSSLLNRFETVSHEFNQKQKQNTVKFDTFIQEYSSKEDESTPLLQKQQSLVKLDNEIVFNEALIQEREDDLESIEKSVAQVNEIFRDLGTLVHEQQYMLDNIESNVASVAVNAENATGELRRANQYAMSSRKRILCLLTTAFVVLLILVLLMRPWRLVF